MGDEGEDQGVDPSQPGIYTEHVFTDPLGVEPDDSSQNDTKYFISLLHIYFYIYWCLTCHRSVSQAGRGYLTARGLKRATRGGDPEDEQRPPNHVARSPERMVSSMSSTRGRRFLINDQLMPQKQVLVRRIPPQFHCCFIVIF